MENFYQIIGNIRSRDSFFDVDRKIFVRENALQRFSDMKWKITSDDPDIIKKYDEMLKKYFSSDEITIEKENDGFLIDDKYIVKNENGIFYIVKKKDGELTSAEIEKLISQGIPIEIEYDQTDLSEKKIVTKVKEWIQMLKKNPIVCSCGKLLDFGNSHFRDGHFFCYRCNLAGK